MIYGSIGSAVQRPYCAACSTERRKIAALAFDSQPIFPADLTGKYLVRRRK